MSAPGVSLSLHPEDDPSSDASRFDVGDCLVDVVERACLADHLRPAGGVELEDLAEILPRADDRADDGDPVQHGLEDRQGDLVVGRQRDEDERATATEGSVGLLERLRGHRQGDRLVGAAELLDRGDRVLLGCVDRELGAELAGELELVVMEVDRDDASTGDPRVLDRKMARARRRRRRRRGRTSACLRP